MMKRKKGFTLIELLVVISIIALLVSILMPALGKAKQQAKTTVCLSNLKQMAMGLALYVQDSDDTLIPLAYNENYWFLQLAPYMGDKDFRFNPGMDTSGVMQIGMCPASKPATGGRGTATKNWSFGSPAYEGSYAMNGWIMEDKEHFVTPPFGSTNWGSVGAGTVAEFYKNKYASLNSEVPIICDSLWVDSWPLNTDNVPNDLLGAGYPGFPHQVGTFMGRVCIDRHGKAINMAFADSHTEKLPLEDLWKLKWHRKSVPQLPPTDLPY